jgi:hypothetical protein
MSNAEASAIYEQSFGKAGIMEDETYYPGIKGGKKDCIERLHDFGKALHQAGMLTKGPSLDTTSGGTYTGYGLMPPFLDPSIVDKTARKTPLVAILPRKAVRGRSYVYNIISAKGGAQFLADDASLADQVDTRSTTNVPMKYLYAVGRVTGPALASASGFINLMSEDIRVKTASINEALEDEIINGNTSTNANGFQGLIQTLTTNSTSNGGGRLTLEQFRTDVNTSFEANGFIDLALTDGQTHQYIKGLLQDFQRNVERPSGMMDFGIPDAFMFDSVLVIKDRYMPTTAGSRRIIYLDTDYVFLAVLQDVTYEELAKVNDSQKYMLKWYGSLVVTFESAMVQRTSLA